MNRWIGLIFLLSSFQLFAVHENELSLKQMLLTPGDLVAAHSDFDNQCNQCHVHFDKLNQSPLCLDCHEKIAEDLETKTGFHSHLKPEQSQNCNSCHTDHQGREADIVGLDKDHFDHRLTDFELDGEHQKVSCESCHKRSKVTSLDEDNIGYRISKRECVDCHADVHDGKQGEQCSDCHNEKSWQQNSFEHDKTDFPLLGEHKQLSCESCHSNQEFEKGRTECVSCHLGKDKHLGLFGTECKDCHQEKGWSKTRFDHFRDANFRLKHQHKEISCEGCHRTGLPLELPNQCVDCHKVDDAHQGANGDDCSQCHSEINWNKTQFDHSKDTDFSLNGAHLKVNCAGCHRISSKNTSNISTVAGSECKDCHTDIAPHDGKLGEDCGGCHNEISWSQDVLFSHDFSTFPLSGAHQDLPCELCHQDKNFNDAATKCESCHVGDDVHKGSLGKSCANCHNTSVWLSWRFNHDRATRFSLQGSHQNLSCELCHKPKENNPLKPEMRCIACHQQDDIHRGDFGPDCQQCHGTEVFDDVR